jgi:hypothetical protein
MQWTQVNEALAIDQDRNANPSRINWETRGLEERNPEQHGPLPACHGNDDIRLRKTDGNEEYSLTIVVAH